MPTRAERRRMTEAAEIKDPAVAVHLARLEGKMGNVELSAAHTSQMLATLASEVRNIGQVSNQSANNDASIKRLWAEIENRDRKWSDRLEALDAAHTSTRDAVHKVQWMIAGAAVLGGITVGLLTWIGNRELGNIDELSRKASDSASKLDDRVDRVEIHLAGDRDRPYRR